MYYSRPFKQEPRGGYTPNYNEESPRRHNQTDWYPSQSQHELASAGNRQAPTAQPNSGADQQESITGMLNNFSKALGDIRDIREKRMKSLGNSPRPSPTIEQQNQMTYNRSSSSTQQSNSNNKMMLNQQQYNGSGRNQQQPYNQQQMPMQQQQRNVQQQQQQQQPYGQQQNMNSQQQYRNQPQSTMMDGRGGGGYQNQPQQQQQQQPQSMYNHAGGGGGGGMYNNQQQPLQQQQQAGRQQQMPQQQGYLSQNQGNNYQQSSLVVSSNHTGMQQQQQLPMQQQQRQQQQQPMMMQPQQPQQQMMMNSQQQQQPMMQQQQQPMQSMAKPTVGSSMMYHRDTSHIPSAALLGGATLVGTPDTLSETGSMKSRSRRTLPYLPPEEPAPLPTQAKKAQERMRAFANFRQSSLDGLTSGRVTSFSGGFFGAGPSSSSKPRPSSSESNLRKLTMGDPLARPGSALGLIQASSVVSSHGPTSATREHEKRILESILPPDLRHLVRGGSPATIQQIKSKLEEDMKMNSECRGGETEIARRNAERRLFGGSLGSQTERIRQEMARYASMRDPVLRAKMKHNLNPVMNAQLDRNRRIKTHRRNLSDPRFSTSLTDSLGDEDPFAYARSYSAMAREYDPMADSLGMDNSRSYLGGRSLSGPDGMASLRDTAINSNSIEAEDRNRYLASRSRQLLRRSSDGGLQVMDPLAMRNFDVGMSGSPLAARRAHSSMSGRYPRSWHPSPFASDDDASSDEPQFFKEEKKNRIKMEIARRRQQIEENACLHDELTRLARLRENAEITDRLHPSATSQVGLYGNSPGMYSPAIMSGVGGIPVSGTAGTSVLKSVDEILRDGHPHLHNNDLSAYSHRTNHFPASSATSRYGRPAANNYDALYSMSGDLNLMSSTGVVGVHGAPYHSDLYTGSAYDRVTDFSPINSEPNMVDSRRHYDMDAYTSVGVGGGKYAKFASYK